MAKQFLWITNTKENIQFYRDSAPKSNLSLHFASAIDCDTKKNICRFVRYLRQEFFFPIRCNVYFCNQEKFHSSKGGYCYGIFYSNEESAGRIYPQIRKANLYGAFQGRKRRFSGSRGTRHGALGRRCEGLPGSKCALHLLHLRPWPGRKLGCSHRFHR